MARRILGFSYVFAFYMFDGVMFGDQISNDQNFSNQNLFEDAQARMESEVSPEPCSNPRCVGRAANIMLISSLVLNAAAEVAFVRFAALLPIN